MTGTIVETAYGQIKGVQTGNVLVWKGIPYAKPPIGDLRFRAPEPPEPWAGIRDATQFGAAAPQPISEIMVFLGGELETTSEDCLFLNIWSPGADDKRRPVMVWIHGGAFISGSGSSASYDGASFAEQGDVVVVTINYRLGIMGFLHLGEIGGKEYEASGNCGILDQVAALKWVQENIAAFGGDPYRVTIFGESAGAMSVGILLGLPAAQGLFHQAILQSGAASNVLSSEKATQVAQRLLASMNVRPGELSKLAEMPIEQFIRTSSLVPPMTLGPVLDGVILPQHPEAALASGSAKDIPILMGTNKDEYRLFTFFDPVWKKQDSRMIAAVFEQTFGPLWPEISRHFIENGELSQELYDQLMNIHVFTFPALKLAECQVKQGASVWKYRFDWESPIFAGGLKACHALEIQFVWNTLEQAKAVSLTGDTPDRELVAAQMHQAWIAFARAGNPNTAQIPYWPEYDLDKRPVMLFNTESKIAFDPNREERLSWEKVTNISL